MTMVHWSVTWAVLLQITLKTDIAQSGDVDNSDTDSTEANIVADGAQVSTTVCHYSMFNINVNTPQQQISDLGNPRAAEIDNTNFDSSIGGGAQVSATKQLPRHQL